MVTYWMIQIEGIDKTGKDLLANYIQQLSNYKYTPYSRGIISLATYNWIYHRGEEYQLYDTIGKNWIFIYLYGDDEDIKIRCKINNEAFKGKDKPFFDKMVENFKKLGYIVKSYNVSEMTYYNIAKDVINYLEELEHGNIS